ncbi:hypothetical protein BX600DRAFT_506160 [Xylariales sp. PMI_506]|nr:hypothetical protein BX600DRAFT_506160 [Xylariales sp. PMI_506]
MAHLSDRIPWDSLASQLEYISHHPRNGITNLYPRFGQRQGLVLNNFAEVFSKAISEDSAAQRRSYPESYTPPERFDIVLSDAVVRKISPLMFYLRDSGRNESWRRGVRGPLTTEPCGHDRKAKCGCPISVPEMEMRAFLRKYVYNECWDFLTRNEFAYLGIEMVKALLLTGEMDSLLRIFSHPDVDFLNWWSAGQCGCVGQTLGWDMLAKTALHSYICLNVLYCLPELWNPDLSREQQDRDYRSTKCYQSMLRNVTCLLGLGDTAMVPHRKFFRIEDSQFHFSPRAKDAERWNNGKSTRLYNYPYGVLPLNEFLDVEVHQQSRLRFSAIELPVQLYENPSDNTDTRPNPHQTTTEPYNPLHPNNRAELERYLEYCWQLLIRCDMMAEALGGHIPWEKLVSSIIIGLWLHFPKDSGDGKLEFAYERVNSDMSSDENRAIFGNEAPYVFK